MSELKTLIEFIQGISNNPLYRNCANGDNRLMAALCLFFNLSHQFDFANYATKIAIRTQENFYNNQLTTSSRDCIVLFNLEHAILSYNACYDRILQIIYFAFHFAKDFETKKHYEKQMRRCKWYEKSFDTHGSPIEHGLKVWFQEINSAYARELFTKLSEFYGEDVRGRISKYSNIIKHNGGISIPTLNTYIPNVSRLTSPISFVKRKGRITLDSHCVPVKLFNPNIFYADEIEYTDCISILNDQNSYIYSFVKYLYTFMGLGNYNPKDIFAPNFTLPFYYDGAETK